MKAETPPPPLTIRDDIADQRAKEYERSRNSADLAAAKRLADEVFREVFGERRAETLQ